MQVTGNNIIPSQYITDDSFRKDLPEAYNLFLFINDEELSMAVCEHELKQFITIESWEPGNGLLTSRSGLEQLAGESALLGIRGYRRVICCSGFRCSALVPVALFDQNTVYDQLRFTNGEFETGEILTDTMLQAEARNVYNVPLYIYKFLTTHFNNISIHHTSTSLIEFLLSANRNSNEAVLTVNVHSTYIEIIVIKGNRLILYNSYSYDSPEELIYYIMFVCDQLHLNPESVEVQFAGKINTFDSSYALAGKYLRNTAMVKRPENYRYSHVFNKLPEQLHFNLFSQLICA